MAHHLSSEGAWILVALSMTNGLGRVDAGPGVVSPGEATSEGVLKESRRNVREHAELHGPATVLDTGSHWQKPPPPEPATTLMYPLLPGVVCSLKGLRHPMILSL